MSIPVMPRSAPPNNWLSTSDADTTLTGDPSKRNQLAANAGKVTLVGGPLDDTFIVYDRWDVVIEAAGGGVDTVQTWGSGYALPANVENLTLMGDANATATGNRGNNLIVGNAGKDRIVTGGGNDVLVAGTGSDYFVVTKQAGTATWIAGLKTAGAIQDKIDLYGYGFQGFDSLKAAMTQVGDDVRIDLGSGQALMLAGKSVADITAATVDVENSTAGMHLTFDDEFDGLSLNTGTPATAANVWKTTFIGGERTLVGNKELELYVDPDYKGTSTTPLGLNPFSVRDGILTISARPADPASSPYLKGFQYTSGLLTTETSFAQTYGYYEIRAETPAGQGLWPAFWLMPADGKWPPELDVMEQIGSSSNYNSNGVLSKIADAQVHGTVFGENLNQGLHTYGMAWTPQTITFYLDGQQTFQTPTPPDMNKPMYMLIDLAVGGTWPGSPDATTNWSTADLKVDYVRVYSYDPSATAAPAVTLSNLFDASDLSSSFVAPATGPGTSTTYTAQQLGIAGIDPTATATVAYDTDSALTITNNGVWNAIKNATVRSVVNGSVSVNNFVDADIALGNGDSTVAVTAAKRGSITVGNGDDRISVAASSNATSNNLMRITAGDGANHINFSGASNTAAAIVAGNGGNTVTIEGQARASVETGSGSDVVVDHSTGSVIIAGGAGNDVLEFFAGAHATVTDFQAGQDSIVLHGIAAGQVQVSTSAGSTLIAAGGGASIQLAGVALSAGSLNIVYA